MTFDFLSYLKNNKEGEVLKILCFVWISFILLLLLYRLIFQKFKKHNKENIGLSAILIIFLTSSYNIMQINNLLFYLIIAISIYFAVLNSINYSKSGNEHKKLF